MNKCFVNGVSYTGRFSPSLLVKGSVTFPMSIAWYMFLSQEPRKGGFSKEFSVEPSVTAKETKNTQGYWAQQYIWHAERHSRERRTFSQNPLKKKPSLGS